MIIHLLLVRDLYIIMREVSKCLFTKYFFTKYFMQSFDSESASLILASDIEFKSAPLRGAALNSPVFLTKNTFRCIMLSTHFLKKQKKKLPKKIQNGHFKKCPKSKFLGYFYKLLFY